jgi:hypothetical protein
MRLRPRRSKEVLGKHQGRGPVRLSTDLVAFSPLFLSPWERKQQQQRMPKQQS